MKNPDINLKTLTIQSIEERLLAYSRFEKTRQELLGHPKSQRVYEIDLLELYVVRTQRSIELFCNKVSKSIEERETGISEGTLRDRLHIIEKMGIIDDAEIRISMRNLRNKVAHHYLSTELFEIVELVEKEFYKILASLQEKLITYKEKIK